jgi:hypothetical protein
MITALGRQRVVLLMETDHIMGRYISVKSIASVFNFFFQVRRLICQTSCSVVCTETLDDTFVTNQTTWNVGWYICDQLNHMKRWMIHLWPTEPHEMLDDTFVTSRCGNTAPFDLVFLLLILLLAHTHIKIWNLLKPVNSVIMQYSFVD